MLPSLHYIGSALDTYTTLVCCSQNLKLLLVQVFPALACNLYGCVSISVYLCVRGLSLPVREPHGKTLSNMA